MIPKECKRLAEVDFPIAVVSKHSAREKSIRHGHPSTLHLWWARRPLAACRAMRLGLLLPDPCDLHCPPDFKSKAKRALLKTPGWGPGRNIQQIKTDEGLRQARGEFVAIFDADFLPDPEFLRATVPHFQDERVGVVQTRWAHLNDDYSLFTRLQALQLNDHFTIEQTGRKTGNHILQFNGTAGI